MVTFSFFRPTSGDATGVCWRPWSCRRWRRRGRWSRLRLRLIRKFHGGLFRLLLILVQAAPTEVGRGRGRGNGSTGTTSPHGWGSNAPPPCTTPFSGGRPEFERVAARYGQYASVCSYSYLSTTVSSNKMKLVFKL